MEKPIKKILTSGVFISSFYLAYTYNIFFLQLLFWLFTFLILIFSLTIGYVNYKIKSGEVNIKRKEVLNISKSMTGFDLTLGFFNFSAVVVMASNFGAYNILTFNIISYILLWSSYYKLVKTIKDKRASGEFDE